MAAAAAARVSGFGRERERGVESVGVWVFCPRAVTQREAMCGSDGIVWATSRWAPDVGGIG